LVLAGIGVGGGRSWVDRPSDLGNRAEGENLVLCSVSFKKRRDVSGRFAFASDRRERRGMNACHQKKLHSYATQITGVALVDAENITAQPDSFCVFTYLYKAKAGKRIRNKRKRREYLSLIAPAVRAGAPDRVIHRARAKIIPQLEHRSRKRTEPARIGV
jgi:hypothetical protein